MDPAELAHRYAFHPANTPERQDAHERVRDLCGQAAGELNELLPAGREKSLVMTHLEEAMFWGNAAIARQPS